MTNPAALFVDLRRQPVTAWPDNTFTIAYIVCADLRTTQSFFEIFHHHLAVIPHITCEITQPDTLPFLLAQPCVTRLSLSIDLITHPVIDSAKQIDAILHWDHRRKPDFYRAKITAALTQGVKHLSLYGLQDFTLWQDMQTFLNAHDLFFYERFHAAAPHAESPYQNHIAAFGDVIALPQHGGGWSRVTDEHGVTRVKGPRQKRWQALSTCVQYEERLLLGLYNRRGLHLSSFTQAQIETGLQNSLAAISNDYLHPTIYGLWNYVELVMGLLHA